jgi:hypothetical protein
MESFEKPYTPKQPQDARQEIWKDLVSNIEDYEREKGLEEIEVIQDADNRTSQVIESYGLQSTTLTPELVHLIKGQNWKEGHAFMSRDHGLFVCERRDLNELRMEVVHEMFHYKGVNHLPIPLTEAIIERLTAQALNLENKNLEGGQVFSGIYTYPDFRLTLDKLLKLTVDRAPKGATNGFHTFSFFAKAHLTGDIGCLDFLNTIFDKGTLENLQNLDDDHESLVAFVENL